MFNKIMLLFPLRASTSPECPVSGVRLLHTGLLEERGDLLTRALLGPRTEEQLVRFSVLVFSTQELLSPKYDSEEGRKK